MSRKLNFILSAFLIAALIYIFTISMQQQVSASNSAPAQAGSALDPIVSKSYLEKRLVELEDKLKLYIDGVASGGNSDKAQNTGQLKFQVLEFNIGDKLVLGESCEFILRSGKARVFDLSQNGIADLTSGESRMHEENIVKNHHMLNPRNDGRGIVIDQNCHIMIKGEYKLAE